MDLLQFKCSLRCASVMYLARLLLRHHCDLLPYHAAYHADSSGCPCCSLPIWTSGLKELTTYREDADLKKVARVYCSLLERYREIVANPELPVLFKGVLEKHSSPKYNGIARNKLLLEFRKYDMFPEPPH